jgi:hypothetical protein
MPVTGGATGGAAGDGAPDVLADAHGAEVCCLGRSGRKLLVVVGPGHLGVQRQLELVLPAELETGGGESVGANRVT